MGCFHWYSMFMDTFKDGGDDARSSTFVGIVIAEAGMIDAGQSVGVQITSTPIPPTVSSSPFQDSIFGFLSDAFGSNSFISWQFYAVVVPLLLLSVLLVLHLFLKKRVPEKDIPVYNIMPSESSTYAVTSELFAPSDTQRVDIEMPVVRIYADKRDQPIVLEIHGTQNWRGRITQGERLIRIVDTITVGRAISNDLVVHDESVSSKHLIIERRDDAIYINDNHTINGTFLNNLQVKQEEQIRSGDTIQIGRTILTINIITF